MIKLAIIGDIHQHFCAEDVTYFNKSDYDHLLFVGDLGDYTIRSTKGTARLLAKLTKPALLIPGNHDVLNFFQMLAEVKDYPWLAYLSSRGQARRVAWLQRQLGDVVIGGYSQHPLTVAGQTVTVVVARPFSLGGETFGSHHYLRKKYGVSSMAESANKLKRVIEAVPTEGEGAVSNNNIIFLAHNGPMGLGSQRNDIWGCDFRPEAGDFGDLDLQEAIGYAKDTNGNILAVIAGHMHHQLKGSGTRRWLLEKNGTTYINAAHVPRISENKRHHIRLIVDQGKVDVQEIFVS